MNLGSGLITWLGFKRSTWDGMTNFLINSAVTKFQISQPTQTSKDYKNYIKQHKEGDTQSSLHKIEPELLQRTAPGRVALVLNF